MTKKSFRILIVLIFTAVVVLCGSAFCFAASVPAGTAKIKASNGAIVRKSASTSSAALTTVAKGSSVTVHKIVFKSKTSTSAKKKWYKVTANGVNGYIRSDLVKKQTYPGIKAKVTKKVNYRAGAGTKMKKKGSLKKGKTVTVYLTAKPVSSTKGSSKTWYMVKVGSKKYYACSTSFKLKDNNNDNVSSATGAVADGAANQYSDMSDNEFVNYLIGQGFPDAYINKIVPLHNAHPNWVFKACNTGLKWSDVVSKESKDKISLISGSQPTKYRATDSNSYKNGKYIAKDGSNWFNAGKQVIEYYLDPRNFLNEDRICMFETLSYDSDTDKTNVVTKILSPTKLPGYGFTAMLFVNAGKTYNVSPAFLASRGRQETGDGSDCINGTRCDGVVVYNPFNIGASTSSNPVEKALRYAYDKGWTTQTAAVNGGAQYLASNYINRKQNTVYFQKFNVANGSSNVATHQYMTNIQAAYSEAYSMMTSYRAYGVDQEDITFTIPVYNSMPASTDLP